MAHTLYYYGCEYCGHSIETHTAPEPGFYIPCSGDTRNGRRCDSPMHQITKEEHEAYQREKVPVHFPYNLGDLRDEPDIPEVDKIRNRLQTGWSDVW